MNNLLKIFLIFNLISAVSPNNYSVPLPETELQVGQNSSEIVKRDGSITLVGGTTVWGILTGTSGGAGLERPCTLSFPVKTKEGRLGFLTSDTCSDAGFFVKDANGELIPVGKVYPPNAFIPSAGLDNTFVLVDDNYWLDKTSQSMLYSPKCGENKLLPIIPTADKTLVPTSEVCAFGGLHSEMACGEILEFDVTIQVPNIVIGGNSNFVNVVKVKMTKDYNLGYNGAPVYISLQVPDSDKFVVDPVGQIVETSAQYNNEKNQDKKIWYYIPLDRILQAGGLRIESGDLSYLLPKPEEPNDEDFNNVTLTDNLTKSSNASDVNLVRRQPNQRQVLITHAGLDFFVSGTNGRISRPGTLCTLGFAVKGIRGAGTVKFDHGFLVLGGCLPTNNQRTTSHIAFHIRHRNQVEEEIEIGRIRSLKHEPARGLNYAILRLLPNDNERVLWDDDESTQMPISEEVVADVYNQARSQGALSAGQELCWDGGCSGHRCGTIEHPSTSLITFNPWKWPIYIKAVIEVDNVRLAEFELYSPEDHYEGLIKVRLNGRAPYSNDEFNCDRGSPVYFPYYDGRGRHISHVQPVGILLDYIRELENTGDRCEWVNYMYCISVHRIIHNSELNGQDLQLYGENFA